MSVDVFAGLDWAVRTHAVCVIDAAGSVLDRFQVAHDREGWPTLMRRLAGIGVSACALRSSGPRAAANQLDSTLQLFWPGAHQSRSAEC